MRKPITHPRMSMIGYALMACISQTTTAMMLDKLSSCSSRLICNAELLVHGPLHQVCLRWSSDGCWHMGITHTLFCWLQAGTYLMGLKNPRDGSEPDNVRKEYSHALIELWLNCPPLLKSLGYLHFSPRVNSCRCNHVTWQPPICCGAWQWAVTVMAGAPDIGSQNDLSYRIRLTPLSACLSSQIYKDT